jgi:hypothetical protein
MSEKNGVSFCSFSCFFNEVAILRRLSVFVLDFLITPSGLVEKSSTPVIFKDDYSLESFAIQND